MARHWPGAECVSAPLKAADRLLCSPVLSRQREAMYGAMTQRLLRERRPLIVVDWSDLKADGCFKLLRAGVAVQAIACAKGQALNDGFCPRSVFCFGLDPCQRRRTHFGAC